MFRKCISLIVVITMLATALAAPGFATSREPLDHQEIQITDEEAAASEKEEGEDESIEIAAMADNGITNTARDIKIPIPDWKIWPSEGLTTSMGNIGVSDEIALNPATSTASWVDAKVPGTVLGNLVDTGYYDSLFSGKDVYFDDNLYRISDRDFERPWWYRTTFHLPADQVGKRILLTFEGISYSADVYVNGVEMENQNTNVPEEMLLNYNSNGTLGPNNGAPNETGTGANSIHYAWNATAAANQSRATMQNHKVLEAAGVEDTKYTDRDYDKYSKQFIGAYRTYELDITDLVTAGENMIAVKVQRPWYIRDLGWMWIDWITGPPDNNMGITGRTYVTTSNEVRMSNSFVSSKVSTELTRANLSLYIDLSEMAGKGDVTGTLVATVNNPDGTQLLKVSKTVTVPSGAYSKEYALTYREFPELMVVSPQLWWPHLSGDQPLYTVDWEFIINDITSHTTHQRFGIREVHAEITTSPIALGENTNLTTSNRAGRENELVLNSQMLQIYVNHRPIVAKGGGFGPNDLLWRQDDTRNRASIDYAKYMGYNMLRDEGKFDKELVSYMDEQGILLFMGWACCDRWQEPGRLNKGERFIAYESLYSLIRYFRQFASFVNMTNGSDEPPSMSAAGANGVSVEYGYFTVEANTRLFEHATLAPSGASYLGGTATNGVYTQKVGVSSGFHMNSSYDYQPPKFFFEARKGIFGFVSEGGGSGNSIPVIETIKELLPSDDPKEIWPYNVGQTSDDVNVRPRARQNWNMRAARGAFRYYDWGNFALDQHYGTSDTLEQYIMKSQVQQYDAQRANHEAVNLHKYSDVTGHVVWMYNNAWPMFFWNTYDNLMNPHGGTFGVRKGNQPVHIMYDVHNKEISVINNTQEVYPGATATAQIYDINGRVIASLSEKLNIQKDLASPVEDYGILGDTYVSRTPHRVGLQFDDYGDIVDKTYNYYGKITDVYGLSKMWNHNDIQEALIAPLTSVYFLRLEVKDASNKVISHNSYALSTKEDIIDPLATHYARPSIFQFADLTKLNELSPVDLDMSVSNDVSGGKVKQTVTITNSQDKNGNTIAYAVELKARINEKQLVAPVFYSDNLFTLFPGETRIITIEYDQNDAKFNGVATIEYTTYNNVCGAGVRTPDLPRADAALGKIGAGSSTVASIPQPVSNHPVGGRADGTVPSGANNPMARANYPIIPNVSNLTVGWAPTAGVANPWFYVDLGAVQDVDRISLRWVYLLRPNTLEVEVAVGNTAPAADSEAWKKVAEWDNPTGSSITDIVFDSTERARFVRIKPRGYIGTTLPHRGVQGTSGGVTSWTGTLGLAARTQHGFMSFEAYSFGQSVFLDIQDHVKVKVDDDAIYSGTDNVSDRLIWLDGNLVKLSFLSDGPGDFVVLRNGADISDKLDATDSIVLNDIIYDETISINFTETPMITSLRINSLSIATVARGGMYRFELSLNEGATSKSVTWTIADPSLGYVDHAGNVTIFDKTGNVRLTATDRFSGISHSITLRIAS